MRAGSTSILAVAGLLAPACAGAQCPAAPPERATLAVVGSGAVHQRPEIENVGISLVTRGPTPHSRQQAVDIALSHISDGEAEGNR